MVSDTPQQVGAVPYVTFGAPVQTFNLPVPVQNQIVIDPSFASYSLPPPVYYSSAYPQEGGRSTNWAEPVALILALILLTIYFIHWIISLIVGFFFGYAAVVVTFFDYWGGPWGLAYLLEWIFPIGFFFKVTWCVLAIYGLKKPSNACLITSIILGLVMIFPEIAYGVLAALVTATTSPRWDTFLFILCLLLTIFTFACAIASFGLLITSTIVALSRRGQVTSAVASVLPSIQI